MIYKMPTSCDQHPDLKGSLLSKFCHSIVRIVFEIRRCQTEVLVQNVLGYGHDRPTRATRPHTHNCNDKLIGSVEDYFFIWFRLHPDAFLFNFFGARFSIYHLAHCKLLLNSLDSGRLSEDSFAVELVSSKFQEIEASRLFHLYFNF